MEPERHYSISFFRKGFPIIISAPSGTGKTETCKVLKQTLPNPSIVASHTTRTPPPGEHFQMLIFEMPFFKLFSEISKGKCTIFLLRPSHTPRGGTPSLFVCESKSLRSEKPKSGRIQCGIN